MTSAPKPEERRKFWILRNGHYAVVTSARGYNSIVDKLLAIEHRPGDVILSARQAEALKAALDYYAHDAAWDFTHENANRALAILGAAMKGGQGD